MNQTDTLALGRKLHDAVLLPLKQSFVGKDEVIDLMGLCLVARENLFILGPPGTAKSALVQQLAGRLSGQMFDYLLTRFTEPNEVFGPFDIRKLRDGQLETNTEGMLPEADFVFLDELLNANSAILNSLLLVLNERVFRRGRETKSLPTLIVVGASNHLPEDEALGALFDRFLMRVRCDNVADERLEEVLMAGWKLEQDKTVPPRTFTVEDARRLQSMIPQVDLSSVKDDFSELVLRLRKAGLSISDRRAVKLQRMAAASALLTGRMHANRTDLWVMRHVWDVEEERDILASLVDQALERADADERAVAHPRATESDEPDAEQLARDLESMGQRLAAADIADSERAVLQDQLGVLVSRCQWLADEQQRDHLEQQAKQLWRLLGVEA